MKKKHVLTYSHPEPIEISCSVVLCIPTQLQHLKKKFSTLFEFHLLPFLRLCVLKNDLRFVDEGGGGVCLLGPFYVFYFIILTRQFYPLQVTSR